MKTLIAIMISTLLLVGCSVDNYNEPKLMIEGNVYDESTLGVSDPILVPTQAPNGIKVRMYEEGYTQPVDFWCSASGHFHNDRVFPGKYHVIVEGPFIVDTEDAIDITIPTKEKLNFYVEPYLRINADAVKNGSSVDISFDITRSDKWAEKLVQYAILYSWTQNVDYNSYTFRHIVNVTDDNDVLGKKQTFTIEKIDWTKPVFVRIAAITSGTNSYNYSKTIEIK